LQSIDFCTARKATKPCCFSRHALRLAGLHVISSGTFGLSVVFSDFSFLWPFLFSFHGPGNPLIVVVPVYIQTMRTLISVRLVESQLLLLLPLCPKGEILLTRRRSKKVFKVFGLLLLQVLPTPEDGPGEAVIRVLLFDFAA